MCETLKRSRPAPNRLPGVRLPFASTATFPDSRASSVTTCDVSPWRTWRRTSASHSTSAMSFPRFGELRPADLQEVRPEEEPVEAAVLHLHRAPRDHAPPVGDF